MRISTAAKLKEDRPQKLKDLEDEIIATIVGFADNTDYKNEEILETISYSLGSIVDAMSNSNIQELRRLKKEVINKVNMGVDIAHYHALEKK